MWLQKWWFQDEKEIEKEILFKKKRNIDIYYSKVFCDFGINMIEKTEYDMSHFSEF